MNTGSQSAIEGGEIRGRLDVENDLLKRVHRMQVARQMVGRVAMDFDDVLHGVLSALDAMHSQLGDRRGCDIGPLLDTTSASLHKAAILSRQLMAFARQREFEPELVSVNAVVTSMIVLLRSLTGFQVDLEIRLGQDLPNARCDANELETILFNLAIDARNAIVGRGRIVLETSSATMYACAGRPAEQSFVQISITDTGDSPGRPHAGEAFHGAPKSCVRYTPFPEDRTSIVMARRFTDALQGRLDIDSHPEAGTAVTMLLPCLSEREGIFGSPAPRHTLPFGVQMCASI